MSVSELIVSVDRILAPPPETVWRALTEPDLYSRWMGPQGATTTVDEMAVTLGGRLALRVAFPDGGPEFRLFGFYEDIDPPRRLVHSWAMEGDEEVSTVVFDLEPHGDGTRLQINHHGLTRPEDVQQNEGGWNHQLDRLEALLS